MREDLAIIHNEAVRAAKVVKNLLTFARKHKPSKKKIKINSIIAGVLGMRSYEHKVNNIKTITRFAPDLPEVVADSFQINQVILNIIINAEYAIRKVNKKGVITITTEKNEDYVRITLTDDGIGISKENLGHIFDPFFTTKEVNEGTGLGLSICHGIIRKHGGRIFAQSELGKGTTLIIELPVNRGSKFGNVE
jgi:signal transduction histidine kinase